MMKTILLYSIASLLFVSLSHAQVGIKTTNPQGVFHIDAGVVGNTTDDIIVDSQGRMGIGTTIPTAKLHIKAPAATQTLTIRDGSQQGYKMLTSNSQGVGTWKFAGYDIVKGTLSAAGRTYLITSIPKKSGYANETLIPLYPLDGTISLPPGRWCVYANFLITTSGADATDTYESSTWMRLTFSDTYGGPSSTDIVGTPSNVLGARWISGAVYAMPYGMVQGFIVILNSTSATKTYHLGILYADQGKVSAGLQITNFATSTKDENGIVAVKIANN